MPASLSTRILPSSPLSPSFRRSDSLVKSHSLHSGEPVLRRRPIWKKSLFYKFFSTHLFCYQWNGDLVNYSWFYTWFQKISFRHLLKFGRFVICISVLICVAQLKTDIDCITGNLNRVLVLTDNPGQCALASYLHRIRLIQSQIFLRSKCFGDISE